MCWSLVSGCDVHGDPYQRNPQVNANGRKLHWTEVVRNFIPDVAAGLKKE